MCFNTCVPVFLDAAQLPPIPDLPWTVESVAAYATACLGAVGLHDWSFGWDRAIRRLGCCRYQRRLITLSRHFVAHFIQSQPDLIRRTLLHEIAHALAYLYHRETGHGRFWKLYCNLLGISGETSRCRCADFAPQNRPAPTYRFMMCHRETGEVFRKYQRLPRLSEQKLRHTYIVGRKTDTLGQLCIRPIE